MTIETVCLDDDDGGVRKQSDRRGEVEFVVLDRLPTGVICRGVGRGFPRASRLVFEWAGEAQGVDEVP